MTRGRKRKHDPTIPAHVDQGALPRGIYWDRRDRVWYVQPRHANGKLGRKNVATADARMSDLHRIREQMHGEDTRSIGYVGRQFATSAKFAALAPGTREDYAYCLRAVEATRTRQGCTLAALHVDKLRPSHIQVVIDRIADAGTPSKANHVLRYLRRLFAWGIARGLCETNPARGVELAQERRKRSFPSPTTMAAVVQFAAAQGRTGAARHKDGCPPYLWALLDLAYLCRLRSIEVLTLTDANALEVGILSNRRKGSRDNVTAWTPRLRAAWDAATAYRDRIWERTSTPIPMRADARPVFVSESGGALTKSGLNSAFRRLIALAIARNVLPASEAFTLHGLKRRGVTDTDGTRADKQEASGHRSAAMMDTYDYSVPVVKPAGCSTP
jgi:integrase